MPSSNRAWPESGTTMSPWTFAATTVPPLNQGRRSRASAVAPGEQRADAGRVAEHLVEGDRDEVGLPGREVEPTRRHERGAVEQHVPAPLLRRRDPLERVLDAGEVRLRGIGEQVVAAPGRRRRGSARAPRRRRAGRAPRAARTRSRALGARELADAVDRVVVVDVARKRPSGANGYASPTSLSAPVAFGVKMQAYSPRTR